MTIRRIHITAFGPLRDFDFEFYSGMNVIRGDNESGKTSLAMFIKFLFYGLSGRSSDGVPSERKRFVNWDTGTAEGFAIVSHKGKEYRIERGLYVTSRAGSERESFREVLVVTDTATGERVPELEECPGVAFFGAGEQVFVNTVFSGQSARARINGADTAAAVENLLFSADENVSVKKAAERLDGYRRNLMHKKGSGGEIPALREKCDALRSRFEAATTSSGEVIALDSAVAAAKNSVAELEESIKNADMGVKYFEAEMMVRNGKDAVSAEKFASEAEEKLRNALSLCFEPSKLEECRRTLAALDSERHGSAEFGDRLSELQVGASSLEDPDSVEDPVDLLEDFRRFKGAKKRFTVSAVIPLIFAVLTGILAAALYVAKKQIFLAVLGVSAVLLLLAGMFFVLVSVNSSRIKKIKDALDADDDEDIEKEVNFRLAKLEKIEDLHRKAASVSLSLEQSVKRMEALETEADILAASLEDCCSGDDRLPAENDPLLRLRRALSLAEKRLKAAEALRSEFETAVAVASAKRKMISREKYALAREFLKCTPRPTAAPENEKAAEELRRRLAFDRAKLDAVLKKLHTSEVELAGKRASSEDPAKLWEELSSATAELKQKTAEYDAAVLAAETLARAGENMRRGVIPKIVRRASALFSAATGGRYESLGSGSEFRLNAVIDGHTRDSAFLSAGTEDLAYVCLRIALATELFGENRPPLVFDEILAFMDPGRSEAAKDAMAMSGHQVFLFTCSPEDSTDPALKLDRPGRGAPTGKLRWR